MLLNLVTNAIKYTPQGGTVDALASRSRTSAVSFTVRDTGIGIAPGDLPHIFERFWRADPARSRTGERPGTGLGLAITKWIAEAHGGSITVQSRPGRGTIFTVRLPRNGTLPTHESIRRQPSVRPEHHPTGSLRITKRLIRLSWNCHLRATGAAISGVVASPARSTLP